MLCLHWTASTCQGPARGVHHHCAAPAARAAHPHTPWPLAQRRARRVAAARVQHTCAGTRVCSCACFHASACLFVRVCACLCVFVRARVRHACVRTHAARAYCTCPSRFCVFVHAHLCVAVFLLCMCRQLLEGGWCHAWELPCTAAGNSRGSHTPSPSPSSKHPQMQPGLCTGTAPRASASSPLWSEVPQVAPSTVHTHPQPLSPPRRLM